MKQVDQATYDRTKAVVKVLLLALIAFSVTAVGTAASRGASGRGRDRS